MGVSDKKLGEWISDLVLFAAAPILTYFLARQLLSRLDPEANAKAEAQQKALAASNRLQSIFSNHDREEEDEYDYGTDSEDSDGERRHRRRRRRSEARDRKKDLMTLNQYEQNIAMEVVKPSEIPVTFEDIGGLEDIIEDLREAVIYPLTMPHLYAGHSSLLTAPSGVLLYGPPGCGKTMLAKALARESGACFINLHISTLTEKWYGDSNKLVAAVFSLARKLQPAIVFIDEIDAVLGTRRSGEHEASGMVKAEFMTHWDGLQSANSKGEEQRICVLGATNRIQDIDEAILRRMPKKFAIGLPNAARRRQIFEITLRDTKVDRSKAEDGTTAFDLPTLVRLSAGMSGSDIKEACRDAAMVAVREFIKMNKSVAPEQRSRSDAVRGLRTNDFFKSAESAQRVLGGATETLASMKRKNSAGKAARRKIEEKRAEREVENVTDQDDEASDSTEEVDGFDTPPAESESASVHSGGRREKR